MMQFYKKLGGQPKAGVVHISNPPPPPRPLSPIKNLSPPYLQAHGYGRRRHGTSYACPAVPHYRATRWAHPVGPTYRCPLSRGKADDWGSLSGQQPPPTGQATTGCPLSKEGPRISLYPSLSKASPVPFLDRAAKFST
jgi:hypothetical protein